jgi:hypothetical protein
MRPLIIAVAAALSATVSAAPVSGRGTWETTLLPRYYEGQVVAFYDLQLDLTWLRDAGAGGLRPWADAVDWAASLDLYGLADWRLPFINPVNGSSYDIRFSNNGTADGGTAKTGIGWGTASELGHLFYVTLANISYYRPIDEHPDQLVGPQAGYGPVNTAGFVGLGDLIFWSGSEYVPGLNAWGFGFDLGFQIRDSESVSYSAWAVHDGDPLAPVPVPAAVWLLASALVGIGAQSRRR